MATTIQNIEILRAYLSGVLDRANHHAQNVNKIALAIAGGIIWRTTDNIRVMSREGEMKTYCGFKWAIEHCVLLTTIAPEILKYGKGLFREQ